MKGLIISRLTSQKGGGFFATQRVLNNTLHPQSASHSWATRDLFTNFKRYQLRIRVSRLALPLPSSLISTVMT
jgi:hypothetical protein